MEQYSQLIGIAAGVCTGVSMLPQLIKLIQEKNSENISLAMLIVLLVGLACWIWYGLLKNDPPIIFTNGFSFLVNSLNVIFALKYKKKTSDSAIST
ncbi:MAG: SemiSWEET transporter [Chitinophagaceae bacterium]|nr:SemiSWEET transporter [Chitinophagaceae bacterium]